MQDEIARTQTVVKDKYGELARQVSCGSNSGCCGSNAAHTLGADAICANLYDGQELSGLPEQAVLASLGCGNPTALAQLQPGQIVLDLGSGGGIDVLLSARRVGPTGKAYGLDMTEDMLELARANQQKSGMTNVEFLRGEIENIPLPDNSVDVIISNCVINLSADKDRVLAEAYRVLKPGGMLAVSDVVCRGSVPAEIRRHVELWIGCVAGALHEDDYQKKLEQAGFVEVSIEPTRVYQAEDARGLMEASGLVLDQAVLDQVGGKFYSGFVRARKP
ncbi:arsenite methyltransferase [bacterium]|nr:arsenite methyltransferase [bacterium]